MSLSLTKVIFRATLLIRRITLHVTINCYGRFYWFYWQIRYLLLRFKMLLPWRAREMNDRTSYFFPEDLSRFYIISTQFVSLFDLFPKIQTSDGVYSPEDVDISKTQLERSSPALWSPVIPTVPATVLLW